jgi:hypothetical protein
VSNVIKGLLVVAVFVGAFFGSQAFYNLSRPLSSKEIKARLEQDVANIKPTLPQDVHPLVTWFDVEARQTTIVYKYRVKAPRSAMLSKRAELEGQMQGSLAVRAALLMLPRGASAQCELYDQNGGYLYTLDLN